MTEHNGWSHRSDSPVAEDVEVETVEAERVQTLVELAGRPIAEQLDALNGGPVKPLTAQELGWVQALARWYAGACATAGVKPPADILRCVAGLANETMSFNQHLAAQGHPDAKTCETKH